MSLRAEQSRESKESCSVLQTLYFVPSIRVLSLRHSMQQQLRQRRQQRERGGEEPASVKPGTDCPRASARSETCNGGPLERVWTPGRMGV